MSVRGVLSVSLKLHHRVSLAPPGGDWPNSHFFPGQASCFMLCCQALTTLLQECSSLESAASHRQRIAEFDQIFVSQEQRVTNGSSFLDKQKYLLVACRKKSLRLLADSPVRGLG